MAENNTENYTICGEREHQELWHPHADLTDPVDVHIPSALGVLGYYVCVRVPEAWADKLGFVEFKAQIGGLRPDDVHLNAGDIINDDDPATIPSTTDGYVWRLLFRAYMSRGDGVVETLNWPKEIALTDLLLCTWPRYITSGQADDFLACQADPLWAPTGIPLGGIGCGKVDLCRDGRFRNFSANNNQDMPFEQPAGIDGAYLAVARGDDLVSITSAPVAGARPCKDLTFDGRFPQVQLSAPGCFPGVDAHVTAAGMFCPHDLRRSSIPGMLVRWHLANTGSTEQQLRCIFNWPNLIGFGGGIGQEESGVGTGDAVYSYWEEATDRRESEIETDILTGVSFTGTDDPRQPSSSGEHLLAVSRSTSAVAGAGGGSGRVWQEVILQPGGEAAVDMALVWAMPHWIDTRGVDRGHLWQNYFADAEQIAAEILVNADDILQQSGSLTALLEKTDLPEWLKARLANCNYPLVTNSVLYRDGRFSINEGPTEMAGCYGTIDQRIGSYPATQFFFPEVDARELSAFAAIQSPNGGINHDLGRGHLEAEPNEMPWPDIPCSFIIQLACHAWSLGDAAFETEMWPHARKALLRGATWAEEGNGVAQSGHGLGCSYDGYHYEGTTPYLGTLWLAALAVVEKWASRAGDTDLPPKIEAWREAAINRMEADLWNGSFYRTYGSPGGPTRETCFAGLLAGQFFCRMLAGKDVLPPDRLLPCADALMRLNGSDKFGAPPDEVTPDGECAVMYGWLPYVEAFGLTAAATVRDSRVMPTWERAMAAVAQNGHRLCDMRLMYRPISGDISWGSYYMTAPASWLVYNALLDFFYTPEDGTLRLDPQLEGKVAVIHPLWWGIADSADGQITLTIERVFSPKPLSVSSVELLETDDAGAASYRRVPLPEPVAIEPGAVIQYQQA